MCNLARLNAARTPLPLPPPLDQMWLKTTKIIDVFHLRNHISEECKRQFSPLSVKQQYPNMNTQVGEQTFTWLYHLKHILCAMPKVHHLFYFIEWLLDVTNIPVSVIDNIMVRSQKKVGTALLINYFFSCCKFIQKLCICICNPSY